MTEINLFDSAISSYREKAEIRVQDHDIQQAYQAVLKSRNDQETMILKVPLSQNRYVSCNPEISKLDIWKVLSKVHILRELMSHSYILKGINRTQNRTSLSSIQKTTLAFAGTVVDARSRTMNAPPLQVLIEGWLSFEHLLLHWEQ